MSRSYKKNPGYTDYSRGRTKWAKRQAAKKVRKYTGDLADGKSYRKLYCSWDIRDWVFIYHNPSDYYRRDWRTGGTIPPTQEDIYRARMK